MFGAQLNAALLEELGCKQELVGRGLFRVLQVG